MSDPKNPPLAIPDEAETEWGIAWPDAPVVARYEECRDEADARAIARTYLGEAVVVTRTVTRTKWVTS